MPNHSRWLRPPTQNFALGIPTCWYLKTLKFELPPMWTPNASQWNIGCVGNPTRNFHIGYVDFMLFLTNVNQVCSGIWALQLILHVATLTFASSLPQTDQLTNGQSGWPPSREGSIHHDSLHDNSDPGALWWENFIWGPTHIKLPPDIQKAAWRLSRPKMGKVSMQLTTEWKAIT